MDLVFEKKLEDNLLLPDGLEVLNGDLIYSDTINPSKEAIDFYLENSSSSKRYRKNGEKTFAQIEVDALLLHKHNPYYKNLLTTNGQSLTFRDFLKPELREYFDDSGCISNKYLRINYEEGNQRLLEQFDCWKVAALLTGLEDFRFCGFSQNDLISKGKHLERLRNWDISRPLMGIIWRQWSSGKHNKIHAFHVIPYTVNGVPLVLTKNGGAMLGGYLVPLIIQDINQVFQTYVMGTEDRYRPQNTRVSYFQF